MMREVNLIAVFSHTSDKLLMCRRKKEPYLGLCNFVGGKIEPGETSVDAAYRELFEETAITRGDIVLTHLADFIYYLSDCRIEVYVGKLQREFQVYGDENDLYWSGLDEDFFDTTVYAGGGNVGHIVAEIMFQRDKLL